MIISKTPLRISFMGGGSDIPWFYQNHGPGKVIGASIDKYMYVIVKPRFDDNIYLNWMEKEIVSDVNYLKHDIARACMKYVGVIKGVEITTLCDVSGGSGLGSSSALTVGLIAALQAFYEVKYADNDWLSWRPNQSVIPNQLHIAETACEVEINVLGKPIGKQDHYLTAFGGINLFEFEAVGTVRHTPLTLSIQAQKRLSEHLMLFDTGLRHDASKELRKQRKPENVATLKKMRDKANGVYASIYDGDHQAVIENLNDAWALKRSLSTTISNSEIDAYVSSVSSNQVGVKLLGAGAGGFLLVYANPNLHESIRQRLSPIREYPIAIENAGCRVMCVKM